MENVVLQGLASEFSKLSPKSKEPASARILNGWVFKAEQQLKSSDARLGWLIASTIVIAVLQRVIDEKGAPLFLLKGGTMLQYRLDGMSRTTKDLDGMVRGDIDKFLKRLDRELQTPWEPVQLTRGKVEVIDAPQKLIKPRRFDIVISLNGITWRKIQIEISPEEGLAGAALDKIEAPTLAGFGLPSPANFASIVMSYQIAQKIHACTDPHDPPTYLNLRSRDVVDLMLIKNQNMEHGISSLSEIIYSIRDVFYERAEEAKMLGMVPRSWPTEIIAHKHWEASYSREANSANLDLSLGEAVSQLNAWLDELNQGYQNESE